MLVDLSLLLSLVDSNDKLYGSDKKFIGEIIKIIDTLTNEVLEELKLLDEKVFGRISLFCRSVYAMLIILVQDTLEERRYNK